MPTDKWGIPFLYPSASTQGVTNNSPAYFFQQSNNITNDIDGVIHFGKEEEDVRVISTTTGEFEFPFLADGDGLSLSGPTGHHSGGETHGCEGFTYMIDGNFEVTPPSFRFRKETYHVEYDTDPLTGTWTNSAVATNVSGWKGYCWVSYVKKDGISAGKDSRVCEGWWNDNPTVDITNWKLLKRTEDKGQGISNWGVSSATCDGVPYQVGTWSNIQFRIKSSSSDFSLHPYVPEKGSGSYIHSIGGADMSFTDSANRGYGYQARMPNNIEMKFLFRWDGGGDGKCRFKNLSLREIDPTKSFDDDPGLPPSDPTGTTEVVGTFTLKRDINSLRTSACESSPASFGTLFYNSVLDGTDSVWSFGQGAGATLKSRIGILCNSSSSIIANKPPIKKAEFYLRKTGSPTGTATCKIRGQSTDKATIGTLDVSTLTGSLVLTSFTNTSNTYQMVPADRIIIEFTGGDSTNYVSVGVNESLSETGGQYTQATYFHTGTNTWTQSTSREVAGKLYG